MNEHRLGINPGFLTKHTLNLCGLNKENAKGVLAELDQLPCMDKVALDEEKQILEIYYDASHHNIDEMISVIKKHGVSTKDNWWTRAKLEWQRQMDENIKDNASHEAHCCNKLPR